VSACVRCAALQVVFKQLLSLKWAERDLGQAWQSMRATKRLSGCVQRYRSAYHVQRYRSAYHACPDDTI
jgi:hypothetical protein